MDDPMTTIESIHEGDTALQVLLRLD